MNVVTCTWLHIIAIIIILYKNIPSGSEKSDRTVVEARNIN